MKKTYIQPSLTLVQINQTTPVLTTSTMSINEELGDDGVQLVKRRVWPDETPFDF